MTVAAIIAVIAGISLGVTVVVLLIRGSYLLGKLVNRVENQDAKIDDLGTRTDSLGTRIDNLETKFDARFDSLGTRMDNLETKFDAKTDRLETKFDARIDTLMTAINGLRADIQQTNEAIYATNKILVGLANHTHDADGRTVFTIPQ